MSGHTAGPWRVNPGAGEVRGGDWNVIVADVASDADARLIAAAPDLLDAVVRLLDAVARGDHKAKAIDAARAAIAKATEGKP